MQKIGKSYQLSASDLVGYVNCRHLSVLDRAVADGTLPKPKSWDPLLEILRDRGAAHEKAYVDHLRNAGFDAAAIGGFDVTASSVGETLAAMQNGVPIIVQGALAHDQWAGRADILRRVESPSALGSWSYEAVDTKLARETRAAAILQLCLYSELLAEMQGCVPEVMAVVPPWSNFEPQQYRFADYAAYYRRVKRALEQSVAGAVPTDTYPEPVEHCEVCRWRQDCDTRRRTDDHLCLVAGISKLQIGELKSRSIASMESLAAVPVPLPWKPDRGSAEAYERVRDQARIQVHARNAGIRKFELLSIEPGFGLTRLPEPSPGDIFLDLEGDPFVGEHGLEYLFGYQFTNDQGADEYKGEWAFTRAEEKSAFENFIDFAMARLAAFPNLHIFHYAPYEPAALRRLMGRYATREEELDRLLRARVFVDLFQIVRRAVRASVESYSIKQMEPFYAFHRQTPLPDASAALAALQANLELDHVQSITEQTKATVIDYNRDDCRSARALRTWLEELRDGVVAKGGAAPRPEPGDGTPTENVSEWIAKINALIARLTGDIPADPEERNGEQQSRWILANILDWHRREEKAIWWEYFRLADLAADDLLDERAGLSGLAFVGDAGGTPKAPIHRYRFPPQETDIRGDENLHSVGGAKLGRTEVVSIGQGTIDIKKRKDTATFHPDAVFAHKFVGTQVMRDSLVRLGEYVADHGIAGVSSYRAASDLLLKMPPRTAGQPLSVAGETPVEAAVRLCIHLGGGILPIQGPPGTGKTYTGAHMICELVRLGKTVGVTANSHKVIRNLLDAVIEAADESGIALECMQKAEDVSAPQHRLRFAEKNEELVAAIGHGTNVGAGTAWFWSRPDAANLVDVLFVDEAGQMSLANALAVAQAANTVVLIGDPQQLDQPTQGSHPDGTAVSALDYILGDKHTVAADRGLFLAETWRLHPTICAYTSELFYDGKLHSKAGLERQTIKGAATLAGSGLRYLPVTHHGNQNVSPEEADAIATLVNGLLAAKATWIDREGTEALIALDDILIIAPYNAQVFAIQQRLPGARVGTVDKFQGQQAPIAIYSTASSSHADAPRGMEFLYSLNRLNVATSRAKCVCLVVASPRVFEADCKTPRQIQLANAFCRYLELATLVSSS